MAKRTTVLVGLAVGLAGLAGLCARLHSANGGIRELSRDEMTAVVGECADMICDEEIQAGCSSQCIPGPIWYYGSWYESYQAVPTSYWICRPKYWWEQWGSGCQNNLSLRCARRRHYFYPGCTKAGEGPWAYWCYWANGCYGTTNCVD
jgi:hypothetical protein